MMTTPSNSKTPAGHMPGLDGLRGLAILAVMFHHFLPPNYPAGIPSGVAGFVAKVCYRLLDVGWWGVDLFFVLSGFLITGILLTSKGSSHFFRNFYVRRSLRIFPLYYGVLIVLFLILPALAQLSGPGDWMKQNLSSLLDIHTNVGPLQSWLWLYGVNIKTALVANGWIFGVLTHFWTLAVEEHFYLFWPLVVYFCSARSLTRICIGIAISALVLRAILFFGGLEPAYIYVLTPCRIDSLVLGGLMAIFWQSPERNRWTEICRRGFPYLLIASILTILTFNRFGGNMIIVGHSLLAITFATAMPLAAGFVGGERANWKIGWLSNPVLRSFGKYSYGIYLLHPFVLEPIGHFIATPALQNLIGGNYFVFAILRAFFGLLASIAIALLSWHLFEKHFLKLKRFFPSRHPIAIEKSERNSSPLSPQTTAL